MTTTSKEIQLKIKEAKRVAQRINQRLFERNKSRRSQWCIRHTYYGNKACQRKSKCPYLHAITEREKCKAAKNLKVFLKKRPLCLNKVCFNLLNLNKDQNQNQTLYCTSCTKNFKSKQDQVIDLADQANRLGLEVQVKAKGCWVPVYYPTFYGLLYTYVYVK